MEYKEKLIGEEVMLWAEKYWHIDKMVFAETADSSAESFDYKYFRQAIINKIDGLVYEKLNPVNNSEDLDVLTEYSEEDYILVTDELPKKGMAILGVNEDGYTYGCYRCNCPNPDCKEWRCSITGYGLIVDIKKWKYVSGQ